MNIVLAISMLLGGFAVGLAVGIMLKWHSDLDEKVDDSGRHKH
jgi:hypothetical protein